MNINNDSHYEVVPKNEYDKMVQIVKEKQDITVTFHISIMNSRGYGNVDETQVYIYSRRHELNSGDISQNLINATGDLIKSACDEVAKKKGKEIEELEIKLRNIHSKWWYKLFLSILTLDGV